MLPPFIVTLGLLGIVTAATRLIAQGGAFPVTDELLGWTGNSFLVDGSGVVRTGGQSPIPGMGWESKNCGNL